MFLEPQLEAQTYMVRYMQSFNGKPEASVPQGAQIADAFGLSLNERTVALLS